jgi:catechol 2,3-dioxygenase-like lactoylglutathione lyase family enzyme
MNLNQVSLPAKDVNLSIDFYGSLGFRLIVNAAPHYARFECPNGESTFSLHHTDESTNKSAGVVVYFECAELDSKVQELQSKGIPFRSMPRDEPWLWWEARLQDPSKNEICFYFAGANRKNPPWRVE